MINQGTAVYHLVAYEFAGRDRAGQIVELVRRERRAAGYKVAAWTVLEVDERGKAHVKQSGRGGMGATLGLGGGAALGLIGGPAGLLAWALGGALVGGLAGKVFGRQFDADQLKAIGAGMAPNTSALVVIVEDSMAQRLAGELGLPDAQVITLTLGSQLSGELAQFAAVELGEGDEAEPETADAEAAE